MGMIISLFRYIKCGGLFFDRPQFKKAHTNIDSSSKKQNVKGKRLITAHGPVHHAACRFYHFRFSFLFIA